jgi:hypothetical protein
MHMFKYCSDLHEDIVQKNIARLSEFQINRLNILGSVIDDDYTIWLLSDDWFNVALKSEHERNNISTQHLNYMKAQCGPMLGLLSDSEWLDVESQWNRYLFTIRTFNVNFLGYFWSKGQLSEIAVDGLNIVAWKYASYYLFAREAYQKIRPRIKNENTNRYISKFNMNEYVLANFCMTTLQSNIIDVMLRFKMGNEILDFIKIGMWITTAAYKNTSASDWVEYYESQSLKPKLPKLAY